MDACSSSLSKSKALFDLKESFRNQQGISLGGNLHHESQHKSIPDNIIVNSHYIYLDRYY